MSPLYLGNYGKIVILYLFAIINGQLYIAMYIYIHIYIYI